MILEPRRLAETDPVPLLERAQAVDRAVVEQTHAILEQVRIHKDGALRELTRRFDGAELNDPFLPDDTWLRLAERCPGDVQDAIRGNLGRIEAFHARQVRGPDTFDVAPGIRLGRRPVPYAAVACYVPGGRASYPSTVLMTVTPARLAGVSDIIVVTPPRRDGSIDPAVAFAANEAGATRILRAGGAQAVAAVAFGTARVPTVQAIVGPGNRFVTAAKQAVSGFVHTDAPAGPSELLVIAQRGAPADAIAWDMLAQAEHDPDAQVLLVTDDQDLAEAVAQAIDGLVLQASRRDIIEKSLEHAAILVADDWDEAVTFADLYAPEHLEIMSHDPPSDLHRIHNAGSIFLGPWAPVSLGDYGSGTNHVLPTMGHARNMGGLSVDDFRKWVSWQEVSETGLRGVADDITTLADAEGLHAHADAVRRRLA